MQRCKTCGENKPFSRFFKDAKTSTGYYYRCKDCYKTLNYNTKRNTERQLKYRQRHHVFVKNRTISRIKQEIGRTSTAQALEYIGCSWDHLTAHLEQIFSEISEERKWWPDPKVGKPRYRVMKDFQIEHIKPCKEFPLQSTPQSRYVCFHWKNTTLLTPKENAEKGAKYTPVPDDETLAFQFATWLPDDYTFRLVGEPAPSSPMPVDEPQIPVRFWPVFNRSPSSSPTSVTEISNSG